MVEMVEVGILEYKNSPGGQEFLLVPLDVHMNYTMMWQEVYMNALVLKHYHFYCNRLHLYGGHST